MIELKNISKIYSNGNIGLEHIDLKLPSKGIVAVFGKSGSGKSTFLNCLGGIDFFTEGEILYNKVPILSLKEYVAYIFQEYKLIEGMSVFDNLRLTETKAEENQIDELLNRFNLEDIKYSKVNKISGGERQRVEIMRALLQDVDIILMDEPFSNLDNRTAEAILKTLNELKEDKLIIVSSHNQALLENYADEIIEFEEHKLLKASFNSSLDEQVIYTPGKMGKLTFKHALWFAWQNVKKNKMRTFISCLFLLISFVMLASVFTILTLNEVDTCYEAFLQEEQPYMLLENHDPKNKFEIHSYSWNNRHYDGLLDEQIEKMNSAILLYYGNRFLLEYETYPLEINSIWVVEDGKYEEYLLEEDEVLISSEMVPEEFKKNPDSFIGKKVESGYVDLKIKGIFTPYTGTNYPFEIPSTRTNPDIMMNPKTFDKVCSNPLVSKSILMCDLENPEIGKNFPVYSSVLDEKLDIALMSGNLPTQANEICVTRNWLRQNGYSDSVGIGDEIELKLYSKNPYGMDKINKESFKIVGLSRGKLIFTEEETKRILSLYSEDSLLQDVRSIIILDYSKEDLKRAFSIGLVPKSESITMVGQAINFYQNFMIVFISLAIVFAGVAILTILNSVTSSILQNKKNMGVLICFKINPISLVKTYVIENIWIGLVSFISCLISYPFIFKFLEKLIKNHPTEQIDVTYFTPNYWSMLAILGIGLVVLLICLIFPFRKLTHQNPADILAERV